jgi:hypothetical protein
MADIVLDIHTQLSESLVITIRQEDGIIAEALSSPTLLSDFTIDDAFEKDFLSVYY